MTELLSVQEAQRRILSVIAPVSATEVDLIEAFGRILCQEIRSPVDLPLFTNSSMDGFAVIAQDIQPAAPDRPVELTVIGDIPAGSSPSFSVERGQAARIMTGAPLPDGADTVVPIEDTDAYRSINMELPQKVKVMSPAASGSYLRFRGQDLAAGSLVLQPGRRLAAQDIGMLATLGLGSVPVYRRPRIALFSTGDELAAPGDPLKPGQIRDSNTYTLTTLIREYGGEVLALGSAPDDPVEVRGRFTAAAAQGADLIVSSAGVSVGAFDYVRAVLEQEGQLTFWRVNMRPGKPLAFGEYQGIPFIGLPGNPVSAFVGFLVFVLPALRKLAGRPSVQPRRVLAQLGQPVESDGRESYLRCLVKREAGQDLVYLTGDQNSGNLYSLVQANALLILPSGVKSLPSGAEVEIWPLGYEVE